ncbi:hypothetical protein U5801_21435 [Lamprobacter modestohalophilus]|uniref:hypothetical protein n=1 Tax=Lamprobacter modestohalophilus TaxID=1064514 RepID=UPI002ADED14F|nr:hypothetical protein [Lamprobacter modestohalophilus]MEA1052348.1 hypothetical protein [Lamprobacter modestohalophilus]
MKAYAMIPAGEGQHTFIRIGQSDDGWFRIDCLRPDNSLLLPPLPIFRTKEAALDAIAEHWSHPQFALEWLME